MQVHWLVVIFILLLSFISVFQWHHLKPSVRRVLIGVSMGLSVLYMIPVTIIDFNEMSEVQFCLRCHEMKKYGNSLKVDDDEVLSAVHYQNNYVPQAKACYSCHTDYSFFGPLKAKIGGLKHLWVHTFGEAPEKIKLYEPYNSANCLHCHGPGKKFREVDQHLAEERLPKILNATMGCNTKGCHDLPHVYDYEPEDEQSVPSNEGGKNE